MVAWERAGAIGNNDIEVQFLLLNVTFTLVCAIFCFVRFSRSDDERAFNEIAFFAVLSSCSNYQVVCAFQITKRKLFVVNHERFEKIAYLRSD